MLGGSGGMVNRNKNDKNGAIWCNLGVPKYVIIKIKNHNFKRNKSNTTKLECIFSSPINEDVHVCMKKIHSEF